MSTAAAGTRGRHAASPAPAGARGHDVVNGELPRVASTRGVAHDQPRSDAAAAFWPAVALLSVLGLALRVWHATTQSLWYDEVETARIVALPFGELMRGLRGEVPLLPTAWLSPLYFALLRAASRAAAGVWPDLAAAHVLRISSVIFGAATIPALAWTARRLVGTRAALVATLLLAVSPFHLWYSQEVRPYALLVLLAVIALGLFDRVLTTGHPRAWAAWALALAAALYTHPIAAVLPIVCVVTAVASRRLDAATVRRGIAALACAGAAFLPGAALIAVRGANEIADTRGVGLFDLPYVLYSYAVGFSLGPSTSELHVGARAALTAAAPLVVLVAVLFGVPTVAGVARLRVAASRRGSPPATRALLVLAWLVLPIAIAFLSAVASGNPFNPRYGMIAYPALLLVLGAGICHLAALSARRGRALAAATLAALVLVSGWSIRNLAIDPRYAKEDCRALGALLAREAAPRDLVLVTAHYMAVAVRYYYDGAADVFGYNPDDAGGRERAAADVDRLVAGRSRVWLVHSREFHGDRDGVLRSMVASTLDPEAGTAHAFPGITVERFVRGARH